MQMKYFNSFYECSFRDIPNSDKFSSLKEAYKNKINTRVQEVLNSFTCYNTTIFLFRITIILNSLNYLIFLLRNLFDLFKAQRRQWLDKLF